MLTVAYPISAATAAPSDGWRFATRDPTSQGSPRRAEPSATDAALADRLRTGDVDALDAIMRTHTPSLLAVARLIVADTDLAQDVVQDVFVSLWDHRARLHLSGTLGGYLARAVRNRAVSALRHERAEQRAGEALVTLTLPFIPNTGVGAVEADELSAAVRRALDALPPRCREIFLLHRSAGLSYATIADTLGVTVATVHTQMYRATRRLVEAVRALG